ncbi:MAG: hypothetical protein HY727_08360 [Candidatus Rokubacteria bacterium]|nr:hypothetical protein [Candidatus Rokubacteria bacterium]
MSRIRSSQAPLTVGVDAGATWVRLDATRAGRAVARLRVPSSRAPDLLRFLAAVWRRRGWTRRDVMALVVASRGIWTARECRARARRLAALARHVRVLSDAQAALLGALGDRPGLLVLSGTGSIVVGRDARGRWARAGGFGQLLGDEGSAFWLGREWLRATTRGGDFAPARAFVRAPDPVARIASLAPAVLSRARRGDRRARAIVREGADHLAASARDVARRLGLPAPVDVSWAGSVLADPWFRSGVRRAFLRRGLRVRWQVPAVEPVVAAARLATRLGDPQDGPA